MNPSSALLQDLLRERKASQHAQHTNRQQSEYAAYERQIQSSPIRASGARQVSDSSNRRTSGYTAPMEMGLREMEEVRFSCLNCGGSRLTHSLVHFQD